MALVQCKECGQDVSSQAAVCPHCGAPIQAYALPPYAPPTNYAKGPSKIKSRPDSQLVWAILALFLCMPLGIIPLVYALQVDSLWNEGREVEARLKATKAKSWSKMIIFLAIAFWVLFIVIYVGALAWMISLTTSTY